MNTLSRRLFTAGGLALLAPALPAQFLWREGQHYTRVGPAEPPDVPAGKIAVTEVFSYVCGGCYQAREAVEEFRNGLPADVAFGYVHAGFNSGWPLFQRAFLTAQSLGIAEANHLRLFRAIWETMQFPYIDAATRQLRSPAPTIQDAARFYAASGSVTPAAFEQKAASAGIDAALRRSNELIAAWKVPSTPSFVVNGRYLVNTAALSGWPQLTQIVDFLVSQERARLKGTGAAPRP